ncbi:MAG: NusG domain II-containing protein [Lachnospiraceae bacterium]|nr:NusG domain II-containing protein [Lachnospiraceae bacterium]
MKWDACLLAGMILLALLIGVSFNFINKKEAGFAVVLQDGEEIARYPLSEEQAVTISGVEEGYNLLMISGGTAFVSDADCPDRLCVRQKAISRGGESIICLPHKLVILIESMEEGDVDAIVN